MLGQCLSGQSQPVILKIGLSKFVILIKLWSNEYIFHIQTISIYKSLTVLQFFAAAQCQSVSLSVRQSVSVVGPKRATSLSPTLGIYAN